MSTGKRLAKRSILGTRVACCLEDGKYYAATIVNVRSRSPEDRRSSVYTIRVEGEKRTQEVNEGELVGSGFSPVSTIKLRSGQKVYITHNNREVCATVQSHKPDKDEVLVTIPSTEVGGAGTLDIRKRLDEVRLLESRKSPRLADTDTDFAKLADVASDRKRPPGGPSSGRSSPAVATSCGGGTCGEPSGSSHIDVPSGSSTPIPMGSRKRRVSCCGGCGGDTMDECAAALVLMKLSCSPRSAFATEALLGSTDAAPSSSSASSSGVWSWAPSSRSPPTPSPPLSDPSPSSTDDGIELDDPLLDDAGPRKRRSSTRTLFQCTWSDCREMAESSSAIESHIRQQHLGLSVCRRRHRSLSSLQSCSDFESDSDDDHEEEFYWTEVEVNVTTPVDPITASGIIGSGRHPVVLNGGTIVGGPTSVLSSSVPGSSLVSPTSAPKSTTPTTSNYPPSSGAKVVQSSIPRAGNIITIHNNSNQYSILSSASTSLPNSTSALLALSSSSVKEASSGVPHSGSSTSSSSIVTVQRLGGPHYYQPSTSSGNVSPKTAAASLLPFSQGNRTVQHQVKYGGGGLSSSSVASHYVQVSSPPTLSHMDMARPPHEDPEYRRQQGLGSSPLSSSWDGPSYLQIRAGESSIGGGKVRTIASPKASPGRGGGGKRGGENSKCRKFFGMDRRQEWCTQCRWKKACTRPVHVLP